MTSKLKCPFCGKKLFYDEQEGIYRCMKFACVMDYEGGTEKLWQALIQAKQDLEIARSALEDIKSDYELYSEQGCRMEPNETDMYNYAHTALKQIDHFADVSKMIEHKE